MMSRLEALKTMFSPMMDWLDKGGIAGGWIFVVLFGLVVYFLIIRPRFKYEYMKKVKLNYAEIGAVLCWIGMEIQTVIF